MALVLIKYFVCFIVLYLILHNLPDAEIMNATLAKSLAFISRSRNNCISSLLPQGN